MKKTTTLLLYILIINVLHLSAQTSGLDTTFGTGGKVLTMITDSSTDGINASVLQVDGKILTAGDYMYVDKWSDTLKGIAIVRYNTNGYIDTSFGKKGVVKTFIDSVNNVYAIALQPNGKIVIAGSAWSYNTHPNYFIMRYKSNGGIDSTFGKNGITIGTIDSSTEINGLAIQHDGKIVATGYTGNSTSDRICVLRFDSTGLLDNTFGNGGATTTVINTYSTGKAVVISPNGKIVVGGIADDGTTYYYALAQYTISGILDASFAGGGSTQLSLSGHGDDEAYTVAIQANGDIVLAGYSFDGSENTYSLVRFDSVGILDNTFGTAGIVTSIIGTGSDDRIYAIAIDKHNKIFAAGTSFNFNAINYDFALVCYNSDGSIDAAQFAQGIITTDFSTGDDFANSICIQPDGKAVLAGEGVNNSGKPDFALARYTIDTSATAATTNIAPITGNIMLYPNPATDATVLQYTLPVNENITIALYDIQGRLINTIINSRYTAQGTQTQIIDTHALANGMYTISICDGTHSTDIKIEKQ